MQTIDLQQVLNSVTEIQNLYFEAEIDQNISVTHDLENGPIVLYERGENNEYQVRLSTHGQTWDQHAYQYSHEACHIRTNYNQGKMKCKWFEESICELASLFTLRRMAEAWQEKPPYENWRNYSASLFQYAENRINCKNHTLPKNTDFKEWFANNLVLLEQDQYIRESNTIIAIKLLDLFEQYPRLWCAMKFFNTWDTLDEDNIFIAFTKWQNVLPEGLKPISKKLISIFEDRI